MSKQIKKHVFTVELPYEDDAVVTKYLRENFERVDGYTMSLGQMTRIPPNKIQSYKNGKLVFEKVFVENNLRSRGLKLYFYTIPLALFHVVFDFLRALRTINFKCDIFLAQHFIPAFLAVVLRKLRILRCNTIVFWMFDFFLIPPQFPRSIYFRGTDMIHRYVRKHIDEMWYTTPRIEECDRLRFGVLPKSVKSKLTECVFFEKIKTKPVSKIPPLRLAFLGSLRLNNAVYESIDIIYECKKLGIKTELYIIGSGPEEERMKKYAKKKRASKEVKFFGFVNKGAEIAKIFSKCHMGLCLYNSDPYGPNWFITSGKFRRFAAQGLPIITTTNPYFIKYAYDYNAGIIVDNDPKEIALALQKIYKNPKLLSEMKKGTDELYKKYKYDKVLAPAFKDLI